jgi:hypothetical protein
VISPAPELEKEVENAQQKWGAIPISHIDDVSENFTKNVSRIFDLITQNSYMSSYRTFIGNFNSVTDKHLNRVDTYRKRLYTSFPDSEVKIAFLLEVHTEFERLFLNDQSREHENIDGLMPMFEAVVQELEKAESARVDFIVLFLRSKNGSRKVIALQAKNIRNDLKKRNIGVYEYTGEDYFLPDFGTTHWNTRVDLQSDFTNRNFRIDGELHTTQLDKQDRFYLCWNAVARSLWLTHQNKNFCTTTLIQWVLCIYGLYINGWNVPADEENSWKITPKLKSTMHGELERRVQEANRKYCDEGANNEQD